MKGSELAFWDSSALVFLCVHQKDSSRYQRLSRELPGKVVWWGAVVEISSAITRGLRLGELNEPDVRIAMTRLDRLQSAWHEVLPLDDIRRIAIDLLSRKSLALRAADSLQLAAALRWCGQRTHGRVFVCDDLKLRNAAEQIGFSAVSRFNS